VEGRILTNVEENLCTSLHQIQAVEHAVQFVNTKNQLQEISIHTCIYLFMIKF
jgi:hypothetical protein